MDRFQTGVLLVEGEDDSRFPSLRPDLTFENEVEEQVESSDDGVVAPHPAGAHPIGGRLEDIGEDTVLTWIVAQLQLADRTPQRSRMGW